MRAPKGPGVIEPRDAQAWWDWSYVVARQLARLPAGRPVTRWEAYAPGPAEYASPDSPLSHTRLPVIPT